MSIYISFSTCPFYVSIEDNIPNTAEKSSVYSFEK